MIVDTHTHLYLEEFGDGGQDAVQRAIDAGVGLMILPNVDRSTVEPMKQLHNSFPNNTLMAIGHHPTEVDDAPAEAQIDYVVSELANGQHYAAIGEIGIDLYWDATHRVRQMEVFRLQLQLAAQHQLPVIIHCREGLREVLEVIDSLTDVPQCVFHSFGGTTDDVDEIRRRGDFYFGINGIVTFKNSKLREVLPAIGIDRILLETDAPYLAPVPFRGKRNESAYIIHTAAHIANALGITAEEVAERTTANARQFFKF